MKSFNLILIAILARSIECLANKYLDMYNKYTNVNKAESKQKTLVNSISILKNRFEKLHKLSKYS